MADKNEGGAVELLTTLARLGWEAVLAYEAARQLADRQELREQSYRFREGHLRHVEALNQLLRERGGLPVERPMSQHGGLLASVVRLSARSSSTALVLVLLSHEQVVHITYQLALEYAWDADAERVLERHVAASGRHLGWLVDKEEALVEEPEPVVPQA